MTSKGEDHNYGVNLTVLRKVKVVQAGSGVEVKKEVTLNEIWSRQATVLIFLRRYCCYFANKYKMKVLRGIEIYFVGSTVPTQSWLQQRYLKLLSTSRIRMLN